jgi:acyl-CoA hydrolase
MHRCAYCLAVFVALDPDGRPAPVPAWKPESERDRALERYALRLVKHRQQMDAEAAEILDTPGA